MTSKAAVAASAACLTLLLGAGPAAARPSCGGKKATIVGGPGGQTLKGTKGRDVIVGGGGDDRIVGLLSKDTLCGGPGDDEIMGGLNKDTIYGEGGDDYLDGSEGKEKIYGGAGADILLGDSGADRLHGGGGGDRVLGGIQDDKLWGDAGADAMIGGHGIDKLEGGGDDDWLRGDVNADIYDGGGGNDTASFATATPGPPQLPQGVDVDLPRGNANGDDEGDKLRSITNVVGSPFRDDIQGMGSGFVRGGYGDDSCSGFDDVDCPGVTPRSSFAYVSDLNSPDPGLVLLGDGGRDSWTISAAGSSMRITGTALRAGPGCDQSGGEVVCEIGPKELGYILAWGEDGDDTVNNGGGIPQTAMVKVDGGYGDDSLEGGNGADLIFAGEGGSDSLRGLAGDDALVARPGGGDSLFGGGGNDNLVTDSPCRGHLFDGGGGPADVSGFGHVNSGGVDAKLGGTARLRGGGGCDPTTIHGDSEVLEGTKFADILEAQGSSDLLIGRKGNDRCIGGIHRSC